MLHLYGGAQQGLQVTTGYIQRHMDQAYELAKTIDGDDPQASKKAAIMLKDIENTLTYAKGIEDLLVKMATLPQ